MSFGDWAEPSATAALSSSVASATWAAAKAAAHACAGSAVDRPIMGQSDFRRLRLRLPPVRGGADPFYLCRKQTLDTMAEKVRDER